MINLACLVIFLSFFVTTIRPQTSVGVRSLEWLVFKAYHEKSYLTLQQDAVRHRNFKKVRNRINKHNSNQSASYKLGLNHFSDWTDEERAKLKGFSFDATTSQASNSNAYTHKFLSQYLTNSSMHLPFEVDWRKVPGRVTKVRDQGQCGSCWAFATVGMLEGQQIPRNFTKELVELSEQNLVDCSLRDHGCFGGTMPNALKDIAAEGGINSESAYPYRAMDANCKFNKGDAVMTNKGSVNLPKDDEEALKKVVAKYGPVSTALFADNNWLEYKSGVFDNIKVCPANSQPDHAVLVVGYGTDLKYGDYWLIKNSWSEKWGEAGYMRLRRGKSMCGIGRFSTVAVF